MRILGTPAHVANAQPPPSENSPGNSPGNALAQALVSATQSSAGTPHGRACAGAPEPTPQGGLPLLLSAGRPAPDSRGDTRLLRRLAWRVISKVVEKLIIDELSILKVQGLKGLYEDLCTAYRGNYTHQRKLEELVFVLERLTTTLADSAHGSPVYRQLGAYLALVSPWLKSLSAQWLTLELAVKQVAHSSSSLDLATQLISLTQRLLADPQLKKILAGSSLDSLDQGLDWLLQALMQVRLWQALPGDATVDDHVQMLCGNPLLRSQVDHSVLQLAQTLSQVHRGYPGSGSLAEQMTWLVNSLGNPARRETLRVPLERLLGSSERAEQLFVTFEFVERCRGFPVQGTLLEQGQWLLALSRINSSTSSWLRPFQDALAVDPAMLTLMNGVLKLSRDPQSLGQVLKDLTRTMIRPLAEKGARNLAAQALPTGMVQELEDLYRHSCADESWASRGQRMASSAVAIAKPYMVAALMGDPLAAVTVGYAQALQTHTSWPQTMKWFVANAPVKDRRTQLLYSQGLNVRVGWQVYQAWSTDDPLETEDRLRQLTRQLKDYAVVKSYPQLDKLVDQLPLLLLFMQAWQHVKAQPEGQTWLQWCEQGLQALAGSRNKSLLALGERLSRQLDTWLADALLAGFYAMRLPGAQAAPAPAQSPGAGRTGASGVAMQPLLLGGIGLEALGLAAIGFALWEMRQRGGATQQADDADSGLINARPPAAEPGSMPRLMPLLVGLAAMVAGVGLLYRWNRAEAPAATITAPNPASDERVVDVDSPIYAPYIDDTLAATKKHLRQIWNVVPPNHATWPGQEQNWRSTEFDAIDAKSLLALARLDIQNPPSGMSRTATTGHERPRRAINVTYTPRALGGTRPAPVDASKEAARRMLEFDKYDAEIATRLNRLWDGLMALASDLELTEELRTPRYLIRFFRLLIIQIGLNESALVDLAKSGTDVDSPYRATLRWMVALLAEAHEVFEKIPRTDDTEEYFKQWEVDSPWAAATYLLKRAFTIKDLSSQVYFEQRQAWLYPWAIDGLSEYLDAPRLSSNQKLWRAAIASEAIIYRQLTTAPADTQSAEEIPQLLVSVFKARVEALGCELYALLSQKDLTESERLAREVAIAELDMRKFCALNGLLDELDSYDIDRRLKSYGTTHFGHSSHQAVFEAKILAVELVLQKFAVAVPDLDAEDKVQAYTLIEQDPNVSDEVQSYRHKSAALAFSKITGSTPTTPYERWDNRLSLNFNTAVNKIKYYERMFEKEPSGYRGLDTFKKSNEAETWSDYYQQFIDYKERFIDFDARRLSYSSLLAAGLTDYTISQMQPKKIVYASLDTYFKLNPELKQLLRSGEQRNVQDKFEKMLDSPTQWPGTIGFIMLADGRVLAMSGIKFKVAVKLFDCQAVQSSKALQKLCELPALPYRSEVIELEGKELIETVLKPLFAGDASDMLSANGHEGFPVLKAPREFRTWWQRTQKEQAYPCSGSELLPAADQVMKNNLQQWVGVLKQVNKNDDFWSGMLSVLPLYTEIRDSATDPDHRLDANSIMWDIAGILLAIMPAISGMTKLGEVARTFVVRTALSKLASGVSLKIATRQTLLALVHNPQFMKLGLKGFAYAAYAGADILAPLPPGLVIAPLIRGTTHIRRYFQSHSAATMKNTPDLATGGTSLPHTHPAWAEMTALGKISTLMLAPDTIITLRGSELTPGEVLEESQALWQPVVRRQPIVRRVGARPGYSTVDACAQQLETRRVKRSAYQLCLVDTGYRVPANLLEVGAGYKIYSVDPDFVVKDYPSGVVEDLARRTQKAWNNSEAFKRLYAHSSPGESVIWTHLLGQGVETTVSVRLRRIPGKSLSSLINDEDLTAVEGIRQQDPGIIINGLVQRLSEQGILLNYTRLDDVVYDAEKRLFSLTNFDGAKVYPTGTQLSVQQADTSRNSLIKVFDDFYRQTEDLVVDDYGLDVSPMNIVECARLNVQRARYLVNLRSQRKGAQKTQFDDARNKHRGFIVPGVNRLDSELKLTEAYNNQNLVLTVEQRGALSGFIENARHHRIIQGSISVATKYARILHRGSIEQSLAPQTYLLTAAGAPRAEDGRCFPLVLGMAVAVKENRVSNFFLNLFRSAARTDASRNEMIRALDQLRTLRTADFLIPEFNGEARGIDLIVSHLDRRSHTSQYHLFSTSHSMLLGVTLDRQAPRTFHFYEPNIGLFSYPSAKALKAALRRTLATRAMGEQYAAFKTSSGQSYKLSRIEAFILKSKRIEIPNHPGPGSRSLTVAELCHELDDLPACRLGRVPSGRASRDIACLPRAQDMIVIEALQEALFKPSVLPARAFESLLDIDARMLAQVGEGHQAALLAKARQQLLRLCGQPQGFRAPNMTSVEERVAYLNYLAALMMAVNQVGLWPDALDSSL